MTYEKLVDQVSEIMTNSDRTVKERAKEIVAAVTFANKTGLSLRDVMAIVDEK